MPAEIHPSAVVDPAAVLGDGVHVGPFCVIGANVVIGEGCWLQHQVTILGPAEIGKNNRFYKACSIGQQSQDLKYKAEPTYLKIGDDNTFREFCTVHRATAAGETTSIGSHNHFLAYSHIAHDCIVGSHVIFSNNGTIAGHVMVEDHAIIGGLSAVHQFCRIGQRSIIGGCAKVVQDVPPFCTVDGNPGRARGLNLVGLQRAGFSRDQIRALRQAYRTIYRSNLNISQAVEAIRESNLTDETRLLADFVAASKRGIVPGGKANGDEDDPAD